MLALLAAAPAALVLPNSEVGIYEELVCTSPESPFIGEGYEFGVSNDGGLSISPPLSTEVTEMSVKFDGSRFVTGSGTPSNLLTSGMTVSAWVYVTSAPTGSEATILELDPSGTKPFGFFFLFSLFFSFKSSFFNSII